MKLFAAGLSYKTAPVALLEQLVMKDSEIVDLAAFHLQSRRNLWNDGRCVRPWVVFSGVLSLTLLRIFYAALQ
jgi:hypothetical protein